MVFGNEAVKVYAVEVSARLAAELAATWAASGERPICPRSPAEPEKAGMKHRPGPSERNRSSNPTSAFLAVEGEKGWFCSRITAI